MENGSRFPHNGPPSLAFGVGGYATLMLYRFAMRHRLRIPDDMALLGFDAMPFYENLPTAIDRIEFDVASLGHLAVDDLLRRFDRGSEVGPITTLIPCAYVAGASLHRIADPSPVGAP